MTFKCFTQALIKKSIDQQISLPNLKKNLVLYLAIRRLYSSMEYYMQKTYYKTTSLISNSCKAITLLAGHIAEVSVLAFDYGKNLGLAFQLINDVLDFTGTSATLGKGSLSDIRHGIVTAPILYAMEEFPQLRMLVDRDFDDPVNVEIMQWLSELVIPRLSFHSCDHFIKIYPWNLQALDYLGKSRGMQRTIELARKHAILASAAVDSLPESSDEEVQRSRRALVELTHRVITRTK
ncbi:Solanesyl-diphosphate synthase 1, mitochondrial [Capsicum annuum]|nr:Solanesyl-diphosphate synthase 1, mitochondrial [Capsicum annuum]KAF3680856.1 Solanesyl-diphosphate synthase 1, mitochondrial [Capsicum annuum]